jgi:hypothetical protein
MRYLQCAWNFRGQGLKAKQSMAASSLLTGFQQWAAVNLAYKLPMPSISHGPNLHRLPGEIESQEEFDVFRSAARGKWASVVTALCDGVVQPYACTSRSLTLLDYAVESATPDTLDLLATMVPPELVATTVSRGMLDPSPRTKRAMETLSAYLDRPVHVEYVGAIVARMEDVHVDVGHLPWLFQVFPEVNADHEVVMAAAPTDKIRASLFVEARWSCLRRAWVCAVVIGGWVFFDKRR